MIIFKLLDLRQPSATFLPTYLAILFDQARLYLIIATIYECPKKVFISLKVTLILWIVTITGTEFTVLYYITMQESTTAKEVSMNIFRLMNLMTIAGYIPIYILLRRHFRAIIRIVGMKDKQSMKKDLRAIVFLILAYVSASTVTIILQLAVSPSEYTNSTVQCI